MKRIACVTLILYGCTHLVGCTGDASNQGIGRITGGVIGGLLGTQIGKGSGRTAAIIGGTVLGSLIGGNIGENMDEVNRLKMAHALEKNKINQLSAWKDPDSKREYHMTPTSTYTNSSNQVCRAYSMQVLIEGKWQTATGTACRGKDGHWVVAS